MSSTEAVEAAASYFSNSFPISPHCRMSQHEIETEIRSYYWHYPFEFGEIAIPATRRPSEGLHGRHYQRYLHIFPAILSRTGGSLSGNTVLDIACNAGFWSVQARLAGADAVLGIDASPKNIDQANFILQLTGLDGIEYRCMNVYDVAKESLGQFDITLFLGLLYHLDKPIAVLEHLSEVTKRFAVVDTRLTRSSVPELRLGPDKIVHRQHFTNRLALCPSRSAVPIMLRHVGFREVFWVPNSTDNLPEDYLTGRRMTFIAVK